MYAMNIIMWFAILLPLTPPLKSIRIRSQRAHCRNVLQLLLAKALIICTSEAPRTVKRSSDVSVGVETRLLAQWSEVHNIL